MALSPDRGGQDRNRIGEAIRSALTALLLGADSLEQSDPMRSILRCFDFNQSRRKDAGNRRRHSTSYALANKGTDTRTLQAYLGHRSIKSTVRYAELAPGRFKNLWR
jgi:integrase